MRPDAQATRRVYFNVRRGAARCFRSPIAPDAAARKMRRNVGHSM
jgi:hypothetical protein